MITLNRGEWSELYVLVKLLTDQELNPADESLNKTLGIVYPILRIIRDHGAKGSQVYEYDEPNIVISLSGKEPIKISHSRFKDFTIKLLEVIKTAKGASFQVEGAEELLRDMQCPSVKASSSNKTDINIVIHDQKTGYQPNLGFSIKSQLGSASTLLNAGKTTNFIFEVENFSSKQSDIDEINSMLAANMKSVDVRGRVNKLIADGAKFKFIGTNNSCFGNNLRLIDSLLPEILAEAVLLHYSETESSVSGILEKIKELNSLNFDDNQDHQFYEYKFKKFLTEVAVGMMPSKVWSGQAEANGGYIVIRKDGEIVCYHLYDRNLFENYLVANTKFETPSTSKYQFGELYTEGNKLLFKLCMQIRFKK